MFFWLYLHRALQIHIWTCVAGEQKILIQNPDLLSEPSFVHNSFCPCYELTVYWFRQGLCPLSIALICQVRLGKEMVFTRLHGSLWPVITLFFVWMWHAPQSNVPPFPNVKGWEICVRKCEYALKYSLLFTTTPYHIPFPSSGQIYLAGFQLSFASFVKDAARRQEYHSKNIFAGQGWHCCQCWGSYLLIKATGLWSVDLGPVTVSAVWV